MGKAAEYNRQIDISRVAELLGYIQDFEAGGALAKHHKYCKYEGGIKVDMVLINTVNRTYQNMMKANDHGIVVDFIKNRLDQFPFRERASETCKDPIWFEAKRVMDDLLNRPKFIASKKELPLTLEKFDLNNYKITWPSNSKLQYYLIENTVGRRHLSTETVQKFLDLRAIAKVQEKNRPMAYTNYGFPMRIPGKEDIVNFELRNYNAQKGIAFKGFCQGGNKSHALWIASMQPDNNLVAHVYVFESAIDAMSFFELTHKEENCAYVSCGGYMMYNGIAALSDCFPNAIFHSCCDNDVQGNLYDVMLYHFLQKQEIHTLYNKSDNIITIRNQEKTERYSAKDFSGQSYLSQHGIPSFVHKSDQRFKDWNEQLIFIKDSKKSKVAKISKIEDLDYLKRKLVISQIAPMIGYTVENNHKQNLWLKLNRLQKGHITDTILINVNKNTYTSTYNSSNNGSSADFVTHHLKEFKDHFQSPDRKRDDNRKENKWLKSLCESLDLDSDEENTKEMDREI